MKHETSEDYFCQLSGMKRISKYIFNETNELAKYIKKAQTSMTWDHHSQESDKLKSGDYNDFESLEEATHALEYGTDMYFENFKKDIKKARDFISKNEKNKNAKYKNDRVGFLPIVPKVIQGNPINMINQDVKPKPYPTARIILEKSNSWHITPDDMSGFYSIIFVLIQLLEERNIRCEIWITDNSIEDNEIITTKVKLKSYTQPLNIYKIQFPIIASDYHRRIVFRIKETDGYLQNTNWPYTYGTPLLVEYEYEDFKDTIDKIIGIEENDIYIPSCQNFGYKAGADIDETLKKIINGTNIKNYIKLNEGAIE